MRILLLYLVFLPLILCSCPDEEEEREEERRADEENRGCRSCSAVPIAADENCPRGFECDSSWQLTSNVLSPDDCSCSELKCADKTAILAMNQKPVGKIRCRDNQWTIPQDPSETVTSAVCAKACGNRVCAPFHSQASKTDYSPLPVNGPSNAELCASAKCPTGIAVFDEAGKVKDLYPGPSLVCSSSGNWKFEGGEERYAMCRRNGLKSFTEMPTEVCTRVYRERFPDEIPPPTCKYGMVETDTSITCPPGSRPVVVGYDEATHTWDTDYFDTSDRADVSKEWEFKYQNWQVETLETLKQKLGGTIKLACIMLDT